MKNILSKLFLVILSGLVALSCDSEDDLVEDRIDENTASISFTSGTADFSQYVALGNSLTAGFMDAALYTEGQNSAYPNIIGQQLIEAGLVTEFNQPDINAVNGFNTALNADPAVATFGKFILDTSIPGPIPTTPGDVITPYTGDKASLNNFGISGLETSELDDPGAAANGFYARFATNPGVSTVLGDALATDPTFFTLWIGANEVLNYVTGGGVGDPPLVVYSQVDFSTDFSNAVGQLTATGSEGVIINIPPATLIPFLRAIPHNPIPLEAQEVTALNGGFAGFNAALDGIVANLGHDADDAAVRKVNYVEGPGNPILIIDESLENLGPKFDLLQGAGAITPVERAALEPFVQARPATELDLIPLTAQSAIGEDLNPMNPGTALNGISVPFTDELVLTFAEQVDVITATATYNGVIAAVAENTSGVELLDVQPIFADAAGLTPEQAAQLALTPAAQAAADGMQGIMYEGVMLAPDFSPNGIFSTDGIHPNPRGHAIVANELIQLINASFGSNIPRVNSTVFRTVLFQ